MPLFEVGVMYELAPVVDCWDGTVDRWLWEQPNTSAIATSDSHMDMDTRQLHNTISVIRDTSRYATSRSDCGHDTNIYSEDGPTQKRVDRQWCL
jgi:hypothetical protein